MIIYGASGHGLVIKDILLRMGCDSVHFVDDADKPHWIGGQVVKPQSIEWNDKLPCVLGIGNNAIRQKLDLAITADFVKAIHPNSILAIGSEHIGAGTVIMAGVIVNTGTKVGRHAILNTSSSIDHECVIEDFVHVSPNATLCGNVSVGEGSHIGAGATIIQGITVGKWATIGAGAVVIRDVPDYAVVVGNPARTIRSVPKF